MRIALRGTAAAIAFSSAMAAACGYCIEDRVAAVYDQAAIDEALARRHDMAFVGIEAHAIDADATRSVREALVALHGVDRRSIRAKAGNAAVAFTYDPARTSVAAVVKGANRRLARRGIVVTALRMIDASGKLRDP